MRRLLRNRDVMEPPHAWGGGSAFALCSASKKPTHNGRPKHDAYRWRHSHGGTGTGSAHRPKCASRAVASADAMAASVR